jgi:hypothetical protein
MAFDHLFEGIVTALVSGGGTASSTILFFRDLKSRVEVLEKRIGSTDSKAGLSHTLHELSQKQEKSESLSSRVERLEVELTASRRKSFPGVETLEEGQIRELNRRLKDAEETIARLEARQKRYVLADDLDASDRQRADEIGHLKNTLAQMHGLLQGLQAALGYLKR